MAGDEVNVGMIGYAFMGRAHSQAWATVARHFDLALRPRMRVICGRSQEKCEKAAAQLGWDESATDWRSVVERSDIDIIDVCTPGASHAEISMAALRAGKHVLCEKPLANSVEEAEAMAEAAAAARSDGVRAMVAFNYRRVPALSCARDLIAGRRLGEIRHVRAVYLQDFLVDPQVPMMWRLRAEEAGSGALGDIGAHIIDLSQFLLGEELVSVSAMTETFIDERPLPDDPSTTGKVTVDDAAVFMGRFSSGALASYEATRFATGRKNALRIEVNGSRGAISFDLENLNELRFYDGDQPPPEQGFRRILMTEADHPYMNAWWPAGHIIGWEHTFSHEIRDFLDCIASGSDPRPSFEDGLGVQRVLDAVARSVRDGGWKTIGG